MTRAGKGIAAAVCILIAGASQGRGQEILVPDWESSVRFELVASQSGVHPGATFEVAVVADIVPGYHLYGPEERKPSRTEVLVTSDRVEADAPVFPPVITRNMLGLGEFDLYEGTIAIRIPVRVTEALDNLTELPVDVRVNYQVCTDSACSAPTNTTLSLVLPVVQEEAAIEATHPTIFGSKE